MEIQLTKKYTSKILSELYQLVRHGRVPEIDAYLYKNPDACHMFMVLGKLHNESFSLLMLAALNGHDELVRLMLNRTLSDKKQIEHEGCIHDTKGYLTKSVTALWCALNRGHFRVADTLINLGGADVNHGPGASLLIDAIRKERFDILYYLIENGYVDVNRTVTHNRYRVNSLFICVIIGNRKFVDYLIARGANINYQSSMCQLTPLHAAARAGHFGLVQQLVMLGASPNVTTRFGTTPMMTAAKAGHLNIVEFLLQYDHDSKSFDDIELIASSFMITDGQNLQERSEKMVRLLRLSLHGRMLFENTKTVSQSIPAYNGQQECQSITELDQIQQDLDRLYTEALLIRERILLPRKDVSLFSPLLKRAITLAETKDFNRCLHLMLHTFYLYQQMELPTRLDRFVWVFSKMLDSNATFDINIFLAVCRLVFEPSQNNTSRNSIVNAVCLIAVAAQV